LRILQLCSHLGVIDRPRAALSLGEEPSTPTRSDLVARVGVRQDRSAAILLATPFHRAVSPVDVLYQRRDLGLDGPEQLIAVLCSLEILRADLGGGDCLEALRRIVMGNVRSTHRDIFFRHRFCPSVHRWRPTRRRDRPMAPIGTTLSLTG
jgi:hypothetical protein